MNSALRGLMIVMALGVGILGSEQLQSQDTVPHATTEAGQVVAAAQEHVPAAAGPSAGSAGHEAVAQHPSTGHDAGGAHSLEPTDLTHYNMSDAALTLVDFRTDKALFTLVVFLLMLAGLYAFAWQPIMHGLEKREQGIVDRIASAEKAATDAAAKLASYEAKLSSAAQEAQKIVADARRDAESSGQRILSAAQDEAARQRERAVAEIESAKRSALNELAGRSTEIAMSLAQRIVGRELKTEDHQKLVQEMLSNLPNRN